MKPKQKLLIELLKRALNYVEDGALGDAESLVEDAHIVLNNPKSVRAQQLLEMAERN
jgi:hypothetical protein